MIEGWDGYTGVRTSSKILPGTPAVAPKVLFTRYLESGAPPPGGDPNRARRHGADMGLHSLGRMRILVPGYFTKSDREKLQYQK